MKMFGVGCLFLVIIFLHVRSLVGDRGGLEGYAPTSPGLCISIIFPTLAWSEVESQTQPPARVGLGGNQNFEQLLIPTNKVID